MSRMKSALAVLLLAAIAGLAPKAQGQTVKIMIAGSSAMWQATGLAAYNYHLSGGVPTTCLTGSTPPCFHFTGKGFTLNDTRPKLVGGQTLVDSNTVWIVWDSHLNSSSQPAPNVWAYIKVDSVVGDRCYFAHPRCNVAAPSPFPSAANSIASNLWGDGSSDTTPPLNVQALFESAAGVLVNAAATDIRPEDGLFAMCRANSALDTTNLTAPLGLGYNSNNPSGACPTTKSLAVLVGTDIGSAVSTATAHVADFNISGTDPFSGQTIPAFTTVSVGASPIIFVGHVSSGSPLSSVTNVSDSQLQSVFSGQGTTANPGCDSANLGASSSGPLDVFLREPLSGTYNTTEFNVMLYPDFSGTSQETGVSPSGNPAILNSACSGGIGVRKRGVGTGDIITALFGETTNDAIGYTFFSYGNVSNGSKGINDSSSFRYFTLNGVDPIFHKYVGTAGGTALDPGQPNTSVGEIPGAVDACSGAGFPCPENKIWNGGLSFPNLRSGQYRAWSILRLVSDGAGLAVAKTLGTAAQSFADGNTPDFVPVVAIAANVNTGAVTDPGLQLLRSHYQEIDGNGVTIGAKPINDSATGDKGGDVAGCILHATPGTTSTAIAESDNTTGLTQTAPGTECALFSAH